MTDHYVIDNPGVRITCSRLASVVLIGAWPDHMDQLKDHLNRVMNVRLPETPQIATEVETSTLYPVHPNKYLIISPQNANLFLRLSEGYSTQMGSMSDQSHGRMGVCLEGPLASTVLSRSLPLDPVSRMAITGTFVQTRMHDTNVLVHRKRKEHFAMLVPTSFALTVLERLVNIAENVDK